MKSLYKTKLQSRRALEKLAHAIEYLTDELVHETAEAWRDPARIRAIQILMEINRAVYLESVPSEPLRKRALRWFGLYRHDDHSAALAALRERL